MEAVWHPHPTFIYYLVRKHIFAIAAIKDWDALVDVAAADCLERIGAVIAGKAGGRAKCEAERRTAPKLRGDKR